MDLQALRHDKPARPAKILSHLKHVPTYLLPSKNTSVKIIDTAADGYSDEEGEETAAAPATATATNANKADEEERVKKIAAANAKGVTDNVGMVTFDGRKQDAVAGKKRKANKSKGANAAAKKLKSSDPLKSFKV